MNMTCHITMYKNSIDLWSCDICQKLFTTWNIAMRSILEFPNTGHKKPFINICLAIRRLNKYILYDERLPKGRQALKVSKEMKYTNQRMQT